MSDDPTISPFDPDTLTARVPTAIPVARPVSAAFVVDLIDPMLLRSATRKQTWVDIGLLLFLLVGFETAVGTVIRVMAGLPPDPGSAGTDGAAAPMVREFVIPLLGLRGLATGVVVYLIARRRGQSRASVGIGARAWPVHVVLGLLAPIAAYCLIGTVMFAMTMLWPDTLKEMSQNAERLMTIIPPLHPILFVPLAVLIGVYEELLFRGFLLTRLRRGTNSWTAAVLLSTALFTALHAGDQTVPALVMVTILSLIFSGLTIWRRSIVPAAIAHALWDLSQFLLLYVSAGDQWQ